MDARRLWVFPALVAFGAIVGCGGGSGDTMAPADESSAPAATPAGGGGSSGSGSASITGRVMLEGDPPAAETIRMNADPVCVKEAGDNNMTQTFVVGTGGTLGNVFVYVKEGISGSYPAPADAIALDQKGCRYTPHVFGVQVGQTLTIMNSDPTLHNIHALPANNDEFNTGQPIQGMKMDHTFDAAEIMVPFKCDVHGWMNAYAGVVAHPFFGVTSNAGSFSLEGLPAGDYVVEAWHEKLGTQTQNVTVGDGATEEISFTFKVGG